MSDHRLTAREEAIEAAWKAIPDDPEVENMDIAARVVDAVDESDGACDPLCPVVAWAPHTNLLGGTCQCDLIARVRADERECVEKVLNEAWGAAKASWRSGGDTYWEGRMDALDYAIRIVEGEQP